MIDSSFVYAEAVKAGFDLCGIARFRTMDAHDSYLARWLEAGYGAALGYMHRNREQRHDLSLLVGNARSVIVCAVSYKNEVSMTIPTPERPGVASYALAEDYHVTLKNMLFTLMNSIRDRYPAVKGRCFTDSAPVFEKAWAEVAGIGVRGKNSLLINPRLGSFILLGEVIIDAGCTEYSQPIAGDICGKCTRCMDACPNGAIVSPGVIDARRCISCLTIERPAIESDRAMTRNAIFGCDICQSVCPHNSRAPMHVNPLFDPVTDPRTLTHEFWEKITQQEFDRLFARTPMTRAGLENIKRHL